MAPNKYDAFDLAYPKGNLYSPIEHINFSMLKVLQLDSTSIPSIEGLSRIEMPLLRRVYLSKGFNDKECDQVRSIEDIRKCDWHNIKVFTMCKSMLKQTTAASERAPLWSGFHPKCSPR